MDWSTFLTPVFWTQLLVVRWSRATWGYRSDVTLRSRSSSSTASWIWSLPST